MSSIDENLIDLIWKDQPPRKFNPIISLDISITGKTTDEALQSIRTEMREKHADLLVITALDEVACELNILFMWNIERKKLYLIHFPFSFFSVEQGYLIYVDPISIIIQYFIATF